MYESKIGGQNVLLGQLKFYYPKILIEFKI